ncbi:maltose acetyltransferase domain-containing protein [uncultured Vibrio sp.]|uniref:maltose acetyltransferase domain-containing protein n=1 Tax=uncultured Vibrio sp. TaxID=114054 RepID=UPI00262E921E|nr:maltose acetyltransferase domain-containing protein [uncultured Vibrio sp.]
MTEFEKMMTGKDFDGGDQSINDIRNNASNLLHTLNQTFDATQRSELQHQLMGEIPATRAC